MLDLGSDSEDEAQEVAAPVVATKKPAAKPNNKKKPAAKTSGAPAANSDPVQGKQNTKGNAKSFDRHTATRKREFDRKSGTGRDKSTSKGGAGKANWGKEGDEVAAEAPAVAEAEAAPVEEVVEEVPDNTVTYEEYLAQQKEVKKSGAAFKALKARKVENSFKKAKPVVSKHNIGTEEETKEDAKAKRDRDRNTKEKRRPELGFVAPPIGGGNRGPREERAPRDGARGGFRGRGRGGIRGGRGAPRGGRGGASGLNLADQSAFPSL